MTPSHHPDPYLLTAAATGALTPAVSRILSAHATLCPHCRAIMHDVETVAGAALDDETNDDVAPDALDRALASLGPQEPRAYLPDMLAPLPTAVNEIVAPALGGAWYSGGVGLRILDLKLPATAVGESFQLFRIEPGSGPPKHTHGGQEFTLVLTGAFKDETGLYQAGDIAIGDASVTHRPVAEPGEVCYALAVTTAPLKFTGPLGVLQRIINLGRR
jgi:putative transcriptional regulator